MRQYCRDKAGLRKTAGIYFRPRCARRAKLPWLAAMRITCPNCHALYEVPATELSRPRRLRCGACGHGWAYAPAEAPSGPDKTMRLAQETSRPPARPVPAFWLVLLAVLLALGLIVLERQAVMRLIPASGRVFRTLGLG
jgi:predicted Zn finger-like uncharacterized protein